MINESVNSGTLAGAIGVVSDRIAATNEPLCTAWLVGNYKAATVASCVVPFAGNPRALKLAFPKAAKECGITSIIFHENFDLVSARRRIQNGVPLDSWESALQKFNCAILTLSDDLAELSSNESESIIKSLKLPDAAADQDLAGSLHNIELPLVMQTIKSSRQEGILYICDDFTRPLAQLYFQAGNVVSARYKNLSNEAAIYQIVAKGLNGRFAFRKSDMSNWAATLPNSMIAQPAEALLIESMRRLDELTKVKQQMNAANAYFVRSQQSPNFDQFSAELADTAGLLWRVLDGMSAAEQLWLLVGVDDYTIFRILEGLYLTEQIKRVQEGGTRQIKISTAKDLAGKAKWVPLHLGADVPLSPFDELTSIAIDVDVELGSSTHSTGLASSLPASSGPGQGLRKAAHETAHAASGAQSAEVLAVTASTTKARVKMGALLGAIDAHDSWHLLHEIPLLPSASGAPIFKDGLVVGMHCGVSPSSHEIDNAAGILGQMLWIDAISHTLKLTGEVNTVSPVEKVDNAPNPAAKEDKKPPGCNEIASLKCPSCGEPTFSSARSCSKCKFCFIPGRHVSAAPPPERNFAAGIMLLVVIGLACLLVLDHLRVEQTSLVQSPQFVLSQVHSARASDSWVGLKTMRAKDRNVVPISWLPQAAHCTLANNDLIHFEVTAFQPSYVYLIYKGTWSPRAVLLFPSNLDKTNLLASGQVLHTNEFSVKPPPGRETVVVVASQQPVDWLKDPNWCDPFFACAVQGINISHAAEGQFLTVGRRLPTDVDKSNALYVRSVMCDHLSK